MPQALREVSFLELLGDDLYTTFLAVYTGRRCVVKFFTDKSNNNNETEVMEHLRAHSTVPGLYPEAFFSRHQELDPFCVFCEDGTNHVLDSVYRIICYEYIEGTTLQSELDIAQIHADITEHLQDIHSHLQDIHSHDFIFVDLRADNIVRTVTGRYRLIDYGRTFSVTDEDFPSMEYMLGEIECGNPLPTQDDDFAQLRRLLSR